MIRLPDSILALDPRLRLRIVGRRVALKHPAEIFLVPTRFVIFLVLSFGFLQFLEEALQLGTIDDVHVIRDGFTRPGNRSSQRRQFRDVNDSSNITQIALGNPEIERAEGLGRDDTGTIFEISKALFELVVDIGTKGEIVDENYVG